VKLSIVTTLYQSATTIGEFYRRAIRAAEAVTDEIEIVMVNDGSPDSSLELAVALHKSDPRVIVVDLSRNFGHHKALMTGLAYATGDLVFLLDSDLQEQPEALAAFYERLSKGDCDVIYGFQAQRSGGLFERITGAVYYSLLDMLTDDKIPRNHMTIRLMTRAYVHAVVSHRDQEFVISQLFSMSGFRQVGLPTIKAPAVTRSYSLRGRIKLFVKHVTTTSTRLLFLIFFLGLALSCLAAAVIVYYLFRYIVFGVGVSGFTSLIVSLWFFGGLLTLILGILSLYIANILVETKRRPYTVVRQVYGGAERAEPAGAGAEPGYLPAGPTFLTRRLS
jgi:putative glycosyltransferase